MTTAKIFKSNQSQAVRLPKAVALPDSVKEVNVVVVGRGRLLLPVEDTWDSWFAGEGVSEDFMQTRDQPEEQERESF